MVYCVIEEPMAYIMELLRLKNTNPDHFDRKVRELEHEIVGF